MVDFLEGMMLDRKMTFTKVIWFYEINPDGELEFDLGVIFKGHLKVNLNFLNGNPYFRSWIQKEQEILC